MQNKRKTCQLLQLSDGSDVVACFSVFGFGFEFIYKRYIIEEI